jgi:hypothetical protein
LRQQSQGNRISKQSQKTRKIALIPSGALEFAVIVRVAIMGHTGEYALLIMTLGEN